MEKNSNPWKKTLLRYKTSKKTMNDRLEKVAKCAALFGNWKIPKSLTLKSKNVDRIVG
jgi:hypothetical protein